MIKPIGNQIVVCLEKLESKHGLVIPDSAAQVEPIAEVLTVGTGDKIPVKEGDRICFDPKGLYQLKVEGQEYSLLETGAIIAILGPKPKVETV